MITVITGATNIVTTLIDLTLYNQGNLEGAIALVQKAILGDCAGQSRQIKRSDRFF